MHTFTGALGAAGTRLSIDGRALDSIFVARLWRTGTYEDIYINDHASLSALACGWQAYFRFCSREQYHQSLDYARLRCRFSLGNRYLGPAIPPYSCSFVVSTLGGTSSSTEMKMKTADERGQPSPLEGLIETLELLVAQARAYERALPPDNFPARAAVSTLGELARQALNEAHDLVESLKPAAPTAHPFSPREIQVLTLVTTGLTNKEIAYRLGISARTVQFHMNTIFNKSGTNSRTEAVTVALRNGWIDAGVR